MELMSAKPRVSTGLPATSRDGGLCPRRAKSGSSPEGTLLVARPQGPCISGASRAKREHADWHVWFQEQQAFLSPSNLRVNLCIIRSTTLEWITSVQQRPIEMRRPQEGLSVIVSASSQGRVHEPR